MTALDFRMAGTPGAATGGADWLTMLRRYLAAAAAANLVWEVAQTPLYTLWRTARQAGSPSPSCSTPRATC